VNLLERLPAAIAEADARIRPAVPVTPLVRADALSSMLDCNVFLKLEQLHPTGSFKVRGAANKLGAMKSAPGVVAASTGNHGLAVAATAQRLGIPATIVLPASTSFARRIEAYGARVLWHDGDSAGAESAARRLAAEQGLPFVSPYNDTDVIAGQGTIGLEILRQLPHVDAVFVALGGGGLAAGIGAVLPRDAALIACSPEHAATLHHLVRGGPEVVERPTLSSSTAGGVERDAITIDLCRRVVREFHLVPEEEIGSAMRLLFDAERWLVEGAAVLGLATLLRRKHELRARTIVLVLCGRNVDADVARRVLGSQSTPL
jgi:threonine dehydratase